MQLPHYQEHALRRFIKALPPGSGTILEVGSDMDANVVQILADRTGLEVVGINPAPGFPQTPQGKTLSDRIRLINADGRKIPLADNSVDGVFTVATIEHVLGVDQLYAEVYRILKPGGVLFADFAPVWSTSNGHHTYAVAGEKEARYWKPGRNPVPDFVHLIWTPDQMREFLLKGPCDNSLVEPIVDWIYHGDGINRVFLEEHINALKSSGLICERLRLKPGVRPDPETEAKLLETYGVERRFDVEGVEATMRKCPGGMRRYPIAARRIVNDRTTALSDFARSFGPVLRGSPTMRRFLNRRRLAGKY